MTTTFNEARKCERDGSAAVGAGHQRIAYVIGLSRDSKLSYSRVLTLGVPETRIASCLWTFGL